MTPIASKRVIFDPIVDLLFEKVGFSPSVGQIPILQSNKRFILVTGGEQSGKSMTASKMLLKRLFDAPAGHYWLVGVDYNETEREFAFLKEDFTYLGLLKKATDRVDPGYMILHDGTRIETKSAKDPSRLGRVSPDGIIACEAGLLDVETYQRFQGRLGKSRGWLFMSGTLEASLGWYPALKQAWQFGTSDAQAFSLPTWTNTFAYPGGRDDPEIARIKRETSDIYFMERIAGEVCPPKGLVFAEFRPDVHIRDMAYEVDTPIFLWEDPGYGSESAHALLVAQVIGGQVQVIDEIYERGLITDQIIDIAMSRPWWRSAKTLVSDPHYKDQHHSNTSVGEIWLKRTGLVAGGEKMPINAGTERLKSFLRPDPLSNVPRIVFHPKCNGILSEFGTYPNPFDVQHQRYTPYRWKIDKDGNIVGETPEDKYNHSIKACAYGLVWTWGYARELASEVVKLVRHR